MSEEQTEPGQIGIQRLLTFSDGVFAIAVTLLVLNLREPIVSHGLLDALLREWPAYLGYVLRFLIIGIVWIQHHLMFRFVRRADHLYLLINVVFLMWVAAIPFPTALLARYLESPSQRQTVIATYACVFLVGSVLANLQWWYASHWGHLLGEEVDREMVRKMTWNYALGPVFYLVDFALAFVSPSASVVLIVLIGLFYAVSPLLARQIG